MKRSSSERSKDYMAYLTILAGVLVIYLGSVPVQYKAASLQVPIGEAYSYTVNFFLFLDLWNADPWGAIKANFSGTWNWYWLINSMIALFSPFLYKEPYSIAFVNFALFGFATASLFRLWRYLNFSVSTSLLGAFLFWLLPAHYATNCAINLHLLQLDSSFVSALTIGVANSIVFAIAPQKTRNAVFACFLMGFAAWGRGNSIPYISLGIFCPIVFAFWQTRVTSDKSRKNKICFNLLLYCLITAAVAGWYYYSNKDFITNYYSTLPMPLFSTATIASVGISLAYFDNMVNYLMSYPGMLFTRIPCHFPPQDIKVAGIISSTVHVLMLLSLVITFMFNKRASDNRRLSLRIVSSTGAVIYFGNYLFLTIFFSHPDIQTPPSPYMPMVVGLTLGMTALIASLVVQAKAIENFSARFALLFVLGAVIYGTVMLRNVSSDPIPNQATGNEFEKFSLGLDNIVGAGNIGVLWWGIYNSGMIDYYRLKNDLPRMKLYINEHYYDMWNDYPLPEKDNSIRAGIQKTLKEADFIILPEALEAYKHLAPHGLFRLGQEVGYFLNSPQSPRFVVCMVLHDGNGTRLLLLKRLKEGDSSNYKPLRLPYGQSGTAYTEYYASTPSDQLSVTQE